MRAEVGNSFKRCNAGEFEGFGHKLNFTCSSRGDEAHFFRLWFEPPNVVCNERLMFHFSSAGVMGFVLLELRFKRVASSGTLASICITARSQTRLAP